MLSVACWPTAEYGSYCSLLPKQRTCHNNNDDFFQKSVMSIRLLENGTLLTGGLDGKLSTWDGNKYFNTPLQEVQVKKMSDVIL